MLVIGNGESRRNVDISKIKSNKIGCNAIYRDCPVNHLVCVDQKMVREAIAAGANNDALVYTRSDWYYRLKTKRLRMVPDLPYAGLERPDEPFHWGSGPYAVLLGAKITKTNLQLIGFDLYSKDGKLNNVYKNTENYKLSSSRAVDPRYWIHQIGKVFEFFPNINFTIYQENNWQMPKVWKRGNVTVDNISNIYYNN